MEAPAPALLDGEAAPPRKVGKAVFGAVVLVAIVAAAAVALSGSSRGGAAGDLTALQATVGDTKYTVYQYPSLPNQADFMRELCTVTSLTAAVAGASVVSLQECESTCTSETACRGVSYSVTAKKCYKHNSNLCPTFDQKWRHYKRTLKWVTYCAPEEYDLYLSLDESGSITSANWNKLVTFVNDATASLAQDPQAKLGEVYVEYFSSNHNGGRFDTTASTSQLAALEKDLYAHVYATGGTNIQRALEAVAAA
jgi:hypothetical protein